MIGTRGSYNSERKIQAADDRWMHLAQLHRIRGKHCYTLDSSGLVRDVHWTLGINVRAMVRGHVQPS